LKKGIPVFLSLCFAFCLVSALYASENQKTASHDFTLQQAAKALQITGTVASVNDAAGTIAVTKKIKDKTIQVMAVTDKETKIKKADELKSLHDIKAGDKVAVVYTRKGEVNLAKTISLK